MNDDWLQTLVVLDRHLEELVRLGPVDVAAYVVAGADDVVDSSSDLSSSGDSSTNSSLAWFTRLENLTS